jgi:hypothetical protein
MSACICSECLARYGAPLSPTPVAPTALAPSSRFVAESPLRALYAAHLAASRALYDAAVGDDALLTRTLMATTIKHVEAQLEAIDREGT